MRWLAGLVAAVGVAGLAWAQIPLVDDRGHRVVLSAPPRRIVSLLPSLTESVCALGACGRLVGTDRFSNWPAEVVLLPKLGGLEDAQVERIVALKPDVVLAAASARVVDRLEALGVPVLALEPRTHAEARRSLALLAAMLGEPAAGERLWAGVERELQAAADRVPATLRGRRVYFEVDTTPYAAGSTSFIGETLTALGLGNAVPASLGAFPKLNPEYVVRAQPEIVIATATALAGMAGRPGWSALHALAGQQTCGFPSARYDVLVRPGPRLGEAAGLIADCLVEIARRR